MEEEQNREMEFPEKTEDETKKDYLSISLLVSALVIAGAWVYTARLENADKLPQKAVVAGKSNFGVENKQVTEDNLEEKVLPSAGVVLPVRWGDLGVKMVNAGVIDKQKFEAVYAQRGGLGAEGKALLENSDNGNLRITEENSGVLLNLLWAFGLGNKNEALDRGPMTDSQFGGAGNFASTGGWTLAAGGPMDHYSRHQFIVLTSDQQQLVERVSKNIYRPCCNNSTYFPDCNHGMAMLGLLELTASQGVSEEEMYRVALKVNSYWFPETYLAIAKLKQTEGVYWENVNPKEVLGMGYSSASGYREVLKKVTPPSRQKGGGCGI